MHSNNHLIRIPDYSQSSIAILYSLLEENRSNRDLKTFIPAFDFANQMTHSTLKPKKYIEINKNSPAKVSLIKKINSAEEISHTNNCFQKIETIVAKSLFFIKKLFPVCLIKNKFVSPISDRLFHYFNILGILLTPIEAGPNRVALLFRSKELVEDKAKYKKNVENYTALIVSQSANPNEYSEELLTKFKADLDQQKIKIELESRSLRLEYFKYCMQISKYVLSNLALIITFSPFKGLIGVATLVQQIPGVRELIDFSLAYLSYGQIKDKLVVFDSWENNYQLSQKKSTLEANSPKLIQNPSLLITESQLSNSEDWNNLKNDFFNIKLDEFDKWNKLITSSQSLLEKRQIRKEKNVVELGISDACRIKIDSFLQQCKQSFTDEKFQKWVKEQTPLSLLRLYVDHQERIDESAIKIIRQIIHSKLKLEKKFLHFKNAQHNFFFYYTATALAFSLLVGLTGGILFSSSIASGIFLGLAISSLVINLSFWLANYFMGSRLKSHHSGFLNFRIGYRQVKYEISNYWLNVKEKELLEKNENFKSLIKNDKRKIPGIRNNEIRSYLFLERKTKLQLQQVEELKESRRVNEAQDFCQFAQRDLSSHHFKDPNSLVSNLIEYFQEIDFDIIHPDLKDLIQIELGIDIERLQKELSKENTDKAVSVLKKDLLSFLTLNEIAYTDFMKFQSARLKIGDLKKIASEI